MRLAKYDRDVMVINSRVLRGIAAALRDNAMVSTAEELEFIAATLSEIHDLTIVERAVGEEDN